MSVEPVAIVHDYLTQCGGAERVVLALAETFPHAPIVTSLHDPAGTFPEFASATVRCSWLNRVPGLRSHHRLALPLLAPVMSSLHVEAEVVICSSSGWAHGVRTEGRKVVYCYTPARWLYQADRYLDGMPLAAKPLLTLLGPSLRRWDRRSAMSASRYLVTSTAVRDRVREVYGVDAEVLPPPVGVDVDGPAMPVKGLEPGFVLCVSRLLGYKNIDAVIDAFRVFSDARLVVVGTGPARNHLASIAPTNVTMLGTADDATLRWLYRNASALISASYEDFGLTPIEAAAHGKPVAVLRWGGFLDTVVEGSTGVFFDHPDTESIAAALQRLRCREWNAAALRTYARRYAPSHFAARMLEIVAEERARSRAEASSC